MPTWLYVGSSPIRKVAIPIIRRVMTNIDLRPMRSPKWPQTMPPMGRAANPTAKVPNAASVPVRESNVGKNSRAKIRALAVP
jgi:hypothetical protein